MSDMWTELLKEGLKDRKKTEEEKAKEAKELEEKKREYEQRVQEIKKKTEDVIKHQENNPSIKLALKILNKKPIKKGQKKESAIDYLRKARELGEAVYQQKSSKYATYFELSFTKEMLLRLTETIAQKIDMFPEDSEPVTYKLTRGLRKSPPSLPPLGINADYPEVKHLKDFAKQISWVAEGYYNTHPIIENPRLLTDDDPKATPLNFFVIKRIIEFIRPMDDDQKKLRYLQQMKNAFLDEDARGHTYRNGEKKFTGKFAFLRALEKEISLYNQTLQKDFLHPTTPKVEQSNDEIEDKVFQTLRQKILTLMLLTFGKIEVPENVIQERVVELFHSLMGGGEKKRIRSLVKNPTAHKENNQSIKLLCNDLNFARESLVKIGLVQNTQMAINEIDNFIVDLKELQDFQ